MADEDTEFLLRSLTSSVRDLCQVLHNGMENGIIKVEAGYEDMVFGPMGAVTMITDQLPGGEPVWTGELHESEVKVEWIQTAGDDLHNSKPTGVQLIHKPTGITRQVLSKGDRDANKAVAWDSLQKAVAKRYSERSV